MSTYIALSVFLIIFAFVAGCVVGGMFFGANLEYFIKRIESSTGTDR